MSQQVQELIDKIKTEGVQAASNEADKIAQNARAEADQIIQQAKQKADQMMAEANQEIKKKHESTEMLLKQSSRDMILSLRKNIEAILNNIVHQDVSGALKPEQLADIISHIVDTALNQKMDISAIEVNLNKKDLDQLQKSVLTKLQKKIKEPIEFKSSDDVSGGFTISFDGGKSSFDFTDESLAQYLSNFLNTNVAKIVKESL